VRVVRRTVVALLTVGESLVYPSNAQSRQSLFIVLVSSGVEPSATTVLIETTDLLAMPLDPHYRREGEDNKRIISMYYSSTTVALLHVSR